MENNLCFHYFICQVMELELKKLYDTAISIQEEMYYLRER